MRRDRDLPPSSSEARMCSYECTFCEDCSRNKLGGICPNCSGNPVSRPIRPAAMSAKHPASTTRRLRAGGC
ncbi:MAG: DUF1272 domain-containing protein [Acidisphaera sp.]|nr:DUF1272 domain-containing protein [Acidisphaera sp.]MBV9814060.1 DUF1272 domain-containing protein [Acetobacteraceae bacterium]